MSKLSLSEFPAIPTTRKSLAKRRKLFGRGVNNSPYCTESLVNGMRVQDPFYAAWCRMFIRSYSGSYHKKFPTYFECRVTKKWWLFTTFKHWMQAQNWENMALDKDILSPGNKIYSPENCIFVTQSINALLADSAASRGEWPQGVNWNKRSGKFYSCISINSKNKHLGSFRTAEDAQSTYLSAKSKHLLNIAIQQSEPLRSALIRHSKLFTDNPCALST